MTYVELLGQAKRNNFRVLSFGNEIKNFGFCFAFHSLIRNFAVVNQYYSNEETIIITYTGAIDADGGSGGRPQLERGEEP